MEPVFSNIQEVASLFRDFRIVVSYDASRDKTLKKLCELKKKLGDKIEILINREPLSHIRVENICRARNDCLRWMRKQSLTFDYFAVIDMDDVCSLPINMGAVERAMAKRDQWDAVSFNRDDYYDIWALSMEPFYFSCWNYYPRPHDVVRQMKTWVTKILSEASPEELVTCVSAFNGFALYRTEAFEDVCYEWQMIKNIELMPRQWIETSMAATQQSIRQNCDGNDCEHRYFHMKATRDHGARICISPEHLFPPTLSENDCVLVSSRGLLQSCDIHSLNPRSSVTQIQHYEFSTLQEGQSIYVCGSALPHFVDTVFPLLDKRFVLVTGDCDWNCPLDMFSSTSAFLQFIESDRVLHWFAQNCVAVHPKLTAMPIGLDYHTMTAAAQTAWGPRTAPVEQERVLLEIRAFARPLKERRPRAYSNFHFAMNTRFAADRREAIRDVNADCVDYEAGLVPRHQTWTTQAEYAFVLSPHGNGLDCHRTWEALALGCIPIVKSSPLDVLFRDLPVWIVQDWSEVTREAMLERMEVGAAPLSGPLSLHHWVEQIRVADRFSCSR